MRSKICHSILSQFQLWTHIGGLGLHLLVSSQRSLGVGVGEEQDMASAVSPWRALLCYDKGQSKQDINRDVLKKEKHSAH